MQRKNTWRQRREEDRRESLPKGVWVKNSRPSPKGEGTCNSTKEEVAVDAELRRVWSTVEVGKPQYVEEKVEKGWRIRLASDEFGKAKRYKITIYYRDGCSTSVTGAACRIWIPLQSKSPLPHYAVVEEYVWDQINSRHQRTPWVCTGLTLDKRGRSILYMEQPDNRAK